MLDSTIKRVSGAESILQSEAVAAVRSIVERLEKEWDAADCSRTRKEESDPVSGETLQPAQLAILPQETLEDYGIASEERVEQATSAVTPGQNLEQDKTLPASEATLEIDTARPTETRGRHRDRTPITPSTRSHANTSEVNGRVASGSEEDLSVIFVKTRSKRAPSVDTDDTDVVVVEEVVKSGSRANGKGKAKDVPLPLVIAGREMVSGSVCVASSNADKIVGDLHTL
jgi:hypothetical protein